MKQVITISRQFGSGGCELGLHLAEALHIPFYDKELIHLAAEQEQLSPNILAEYEESVVRTGGFLPRAKLFSVYQQTMTDKIYVAQYRIIKALAEQESCVIVGRCANYVLEGRSINLFIHADLSARIQRKLALNLGIPEEQMPQHIRGVDKMRKQYYQHYTGRVWGNAQDYDLCIDSTQIGAEGSAELALCYLKRLGAV